MTRKDLFVNYLDQAKTQGIRLLFIIGAMTGAYLVGIYFGWREPIKDITNLTPAFLGAIIGYLFTVPYIQSKQ